VDPAQQKEALVIPTGRGGRPRVEQLMGDPALSAKARAQREQGMSWSEVAASLGVGRTTARRLCLEARESDAGAIPGRNVRDDASDQAQFRNDAKNVQKHTSKACGGNQGKADDGTPAEDDAAGASDTPDSEDEQHLPKTFRLFASLLKDASEAKGKSGVA